MADTSVRKRIFWRCLLEFGPPAIVGAAWAVWNFNGTAASAVANFSAAFVSLGIVWANFLRIQYQQTVRAQQENASEQIKEMTDNLGRVEGSIQKLSAMVSANLSALPPERAREITSAVNDANNAVSTANNAFRELTAKPTIGNFILRAALGGLLKADAKYPPTANS